MLNAVRRLRRRVVVTGCGVVTCLGCSTGAFWSNLLAGRSGIGPITGFDASALSVRIAGEVRGFDASAFMPAKVERRLDLFAQYALAAAVQAAGQAGLSGEAADRTAVLVGTGYGPHRWHARTADRIREKGVRGIEAHYGVTIGPDAPAVEISMRFGATGPSGSRSTACATGATCLGEALRLIQLGVADVAFAGAADDIITLADVAASARTGAMSVRNDEPERASRPFDQDRDGYVMSAGAGVLVLEEAGRALDRGAPILAELAGYGAVTEAHHLTAPRPDGAGAREAMRSALADAGLRPDEIDHVNAHGTGTWLNDRIEARAVRDVFGAHADRLAISSVKGAIGHAMGAAGAIEAVATVMSIVDGTLPPTLNCDDPEDPGLDFVPGEARRRAVRAAVSNSFGFGGHNASLVMKRWVP